VDGGSTLLLLRIEEDGVMYIPINIRQIKINYSDIHASVAETRKVRQEFKEIAASIIGGQVDEAKDRLIDEVNSHAVTQELIDGEKEGSSLVGGGTLFSYVGFPEGSKPHEQIIPFLRQSIAIRRDEIRKVPNKLEWSIPIQIPDLQDFDTAGVAEIPWMGRSFISQIEDGIPGMGHYLYFRKRLNTEKSISKHGLQSKYYVKEPIKSVESVKSRYMSDILDRFIRRIQ